MVGALRMRSEEGGGAGARAARAREGGGNAALRRAVEF